MSYRVAGDFTRAAKQAEAPLTSVRFTHPLSIMKHQVSAADYQRCADEAGCRPLNPGVKPAADRPAVQISWHDADAYAVWLSRKTGEHYRLPTDEEWAFAAGSRYKDDVLPVDDNDPSKRWLARYDRESNREIGADSEPQPFGHFGVNENGLYDTAGNVWEWTSTCFVRTRLDGAGQAVVEAFQLRSSRRPGPASHLCDGFHPRRPRRRLRGRRTPERSRLPPGARAQALAEPVFIRAPQGTVDRTVITRRRDILTCLESLLNREMESL